MHSRGDATAAGFALAVALIAAVPLGAGGGPDAASPPTEGIPSRAEIARARDAVKADPNLAAETTIKTLRWNRSSRKPQKRAAWLDWLVELFRWMDRSARVLVWSGAVLLVGLIGVAIVRMARSYVPAQRADAFVVPTHVRDLDIRPAALPTDVGAAARALWDGGEHRAALALLYRGLLSRLVHVHGLRVRDSTTEGDCLALAASLAQARREYASQLVRAWQRHTYGGQGVPTAIVHGLCDDFARALDAASPPPGSTARPEVA